MMDHLHAETGDRRATFLLKFDEYLVQFMIGSNMTIYGHTAADDHQREKYVALSQKVFFRLILGKRR